MGGKGGGERQAFNGTHNAEMFPPGLCFCGNDSLVYKLPLRHRKLRNHNMLLRNIRHNVLLIRLERIK